MKFIPVKQSWIKFFAVCNHRLDYRIFAFVIFLFVILTPLQIQACVVSCKSNLNISLDEFGQANITPSILLQDPSCDPNDFTVDITDPQNNSIGNILTCQYVGMTMTATVTKISNGNSCSTIINVEDHINPVISCVDTVVLCIEPTNPNDLGFPTAWDNCSTFTNDDLSYSDEFIDLPCFAVQGNDTITSQIERTWTISDPSGNIGTCIQTIYLKRATINDVEFPLHRDGFDLPALDCSDDPEDLMLTGKPTINGKSIEIGGNCEIVVSFSDQVIEICSPESYQILRTWTAIDYCSSDFTLNVQVIKVMDTSPPLISCPGDITVGTSTLSCDATVTLPFAAATDDCSGFSIEAEWSFGDGYGPFFNVPIGEYDVIYTALDDCGNSSSCIMILTVIDDIVPTPVCDLIIDVNLSASGTVSVPASSFNDGSFDNCGIESIAVSRDGINFNTTVEFNCNDIDSVSIPITLRIWDTSGNFNECVVNAIIDDKIYPVISCPSNVYIDCFEDYTDLDLTGEPLVIDNCEVDTVYYNDVVDLNSCSVGSVIRVWTVKDKKGNSAACVQTIFLEDNTPVSIVFPNNFVTYDCAANTEPSVTGEPLVVNDDCEIVGVTFDDNIFNISPSCYSILREWKAFDWCIYDPNSGSNEGYWTHTQIIEVFDTIAPVITCPADTVVGMYSVNCDGVYVNVPVAMAIDFCNPEVSITNNSPYADSTFADASGFYPPGIHNITFVAEDGCGNSDVCNTQVVVVDAKSPTPICLEIAVSLDLDGTVTIIPEMINNGSFDNCTASGNLIFDVSPNIFTCDELGEQTIVFTVTDEEGNSDYCETTISIQDNNVVCQLPLANVSGLVLTETGVPVQLTDIILSGDLGDTISNDATGYFEFPELSMGGNYTITPSKNIFPLNGVSTFDLIFIRRHILGIQALSSPYKMIASDVNKSGNISAFDMVLLSKLILQIDTVFSGNTPWRFVDASFVFPDPTNPFLTEFPESISFTDLNQTEVSSEFIGVKIGDVNGTVNPSQIDESDQRNNGIPFVLQIPNQHLEAGKEYAIPIKATEFEELLGYQFTLDFDHQALEFLGVEKGKLDNLSENNFGFSYLEQGLISTNWINEQNINLENGETLFSLKFKANRNVEIRDLVKVNSKIAKAEAYNSKFEIIEIELFYDDISAKNNIDSPKVTLHQNVPNPFNESTSIGFEVANGGECFLTVFNIAGQQILNKKIKAIKGYNEVTFYKKEINKSGIYFYQLVTPSGKSLIKKLIVE